MERVARMKVLIMSWMVLKALLFLSLSFPKVNYPIARDEWSAVLRGTEWVQMAKMNKREIVTIFIRGDEHRILCLMVRCHYLAL